MLSIWWCSCVASSLGMFHWSIFLFLCWYYTVLITAALGTANRDYIWKRWTFSPSWFCVLTVSICNFYNQKSIFLKEIRRILPVKTVSRLSPTKIPQIPAKMNLSFTTSLLCFYLIWSYSFIFGICIVFFFYAVINASLTTITILSFSENGSSLISLEPDNSIHRQRRSSLSGSDFLEGGGWESSSLSPSASHSGCSLCTCWAG